MLYIIYGKERLLMDQRLQKLKKQFNCFDEFMNYTVYDLSKTTMQEVLEDIQVPPFLSDHKMVVVKNPDFLTTKKIKKDNDDAKIFEQCLAYLDESIHLVIFHDEKNFDERKKLVKMLRKQPNFYEINELTANKVQDTIRQSIKKRNCVIDDDALELFLSRKGMNLIDLQLDVEKLCLYTNHIDKQAIDLLISKPIDENIFNLTTAILSKDKKAMMSIYRDLLIRKEEPIKLIIMVANSMRSIYQVKLLDRKGYNDQEIGKLLSMNPFRLKYIRKDGKNFEIQELLYCLNELSKLDVGIKTGKIDKKRGFELFMLRL